MKTLCFNCGKRIIKNDFTWIRLPSTALTKICPNCAAEINKQNNQGKAKDEVKK